MLKNFMGVIFNKFSYKKNYISRFFKCQKSIFGLMSTWGKNANTFKTVNNRKKCAAEVDICKAL